MLLCGQVMHDLPSDVPACKIDCRSQKMSTPRGFLAAVRSAMCSNSILTSNRPGARMQVCMHASCMHSSRFVSPQWPSLLSSELCSCCATAGRPLSTMTLEKSGRRLTWMPAIALSRQQTPLSAPSLMRSLAAWTSRQSRRCSCSTRPAPWPAGRMLRHRRLRRRA